MDEIRVMFRKGEQILSLIDLACAGIWILVLKGELVAE